MAEWIFVFGPLVIDLLMTNIVLPILKNYKIKEKKFKKRLEKATSELKEFLTVKEFAVYLAKYLNKPFIKKISKGENIEETFKGILQKKFKSRHFREVINELMEIFTTKSYYFYLMKVDELLDYSFFKNLFLPANPSLWDESFVREIGKMVRISIASLATEEKKKEFEEDFLRDEINIYNKFLDKLGRINLLGYRLWIRADEEKMKDFKYEVEEALQFIRKYRKTLKSNDKTKKKLLYIEELLRLFQQYGRGKIKLIKIKNKMNLDRDVFENDPYFDNYMQLRNENLTYRESYEQIIRNLNEDYKLLKNSSV